MLINLQSIDETSLTVRLFSRHSPTAFQVQYQSITPSDMPSLPPSLFSFIFRFHLSLSLFAFIFLFRVSLSSSSFIFSPVFLFCHELQLFRSAWPFDSSTLVHLLFAVSDSPSTIFFPSVFPTLTICMTCTIVSTKCVKHSLVPSRPPRDHGAGLAG